jgi:hypothetical protein
MEEWIKDKFIEMVKVPSKDNLADWFTKGTLTYEQFCHNRSGVMHPLNSSALVEPPAKSSSNVQSK